MEFGVATGYARPFAFNCQYRVRRDGVIAPYRDRARRIQELELGAPTSLQNSSTSTLTYNLALLGSMNNE
jgi:hypothetical protein